MVSSMSTPSEHGEIQLGKPKRVLFKYAVSPLALPEWWILTDAQLEQALEVSEKDVKDASAGVLKDLKRFQLEKEDDLKRYMVRRIFVEGYSVADTSCADGVRQMSY